MGGSQSNFELTENEQGSGENPEGFVGENQEGNVPQD